MNVTGTRQVAFWLIALVGSLVAHVGILAVLIIAVRPDPVRNQPMPTSELEVQAYQLDRVEAIERPPESQPTGAETPDGQALDAGAIPQSKAQVAQPKIETLQAEPPHPAAAIQITQAAPLIAGKAPDATKTTLLETDISPTPPVKAEIQPAPQATPTATRLKTLVQSQPRLKPSQVIAATLSPTVAQIPSAIPAVLRAESAPSVASPALSVLPVSAPQAPIMQAALPDLSAIAALTPTPTPLAVTAANFAPATLVAMTAGTLPLAVPAVVVTGPAPAPSLALPTTLPPAPTLQPRAAPGDVVPVALPDPDSLPVADPDPDNLLPGLPDFVPARPGLPDFAPLASAAPNAQRLRAALAFSGADGDVDPISIAAFQIFMQPGDITASGDRLRDGVTGLLAQVPCSRMQVIFDPDTATLQVNGHIPDDDLRAPVLAALRQQMGASITVSDNILILPRPQCGALSGIANVGLPQSTDQITNPLVIGDDAHVRVFSFSEGQLLSLDMTAPDYDAFIYLDYFDADGMVLHLEPNEYAPLRQANAQSAKQIGARSMQDVGLKLVISPPFGQEIAVAFAASEPLYQGLRPIQEPAAPYLEWLQQQVENARANNPDFKGEWVYFFVSTTGQ